MNVFQSFLYNVFIDEKNKKKNIQINYFRILICISDNATTNNLIFHLRQQFRVDVKIKNVVIIRMHNIKTEKKILNVKNVDQKLKKLQSTNEFEFNESKKNLKIINVNEFFHSFSITKEFANDFEFKLNYQKIEILINVSQFNVASYVYQMFHKSYKQFYEMRNKRYILHNMNLTI